MEQDRAARLKLVLVDNREDGHVVLDALVGRHDTVDVVNDLLQVANRKGRASELINFDALFFLVLILRLEKLLVLDELLFHQQVVFDSILAEQSQPALGTGCNRRQLCRLLDASLFLLLANMLRTSLLSSLL